MTFQLMLLAALLEEADQSPEQSYDAITLVRVVQEEGILRLGYRLDDPNDDRLEVDLMWLSDNVLDGFPPVTLLPHVSLRIRALRDRAVFA